MTNIADDGLVFHFAHVLGGDDVFVTRGRNKNISCFEGIFDCIYLKPGHTCLKSTNWIDL